MHIIDFAIIHLKFIFATASTSHIVHFDLGERCNVQYIHPDMPVVIYSNDLMGTTDARDRT